jgi:hypothetical protein
MNTYNVTIRATVTKTMTIEANSADEAAATANDLFTTECEGPDEDYQQDVLDVSEVFATDDSRSNGPHQ